MKAGGGEIDRWREAYDSKASPKNGICLRSEERRDAPVVDLTYRTPEWPVEQTVPVDLT